MEQSTQTDDAVHQVSLILRRVDRLIKEGDVDESLREIIRAKEIYPKHGYIGAYEERIAYLREEHEKNSALEKTKEAAEEAARRRDDELRREHEKERRRLEENLKREEMERRREQERIKTDLERIERSKTRASGGSEGSQIYSEASPKSRAEVILVIDDDEQMLDMLSDALASEGYETRTFQRSDDAYDLLKSWTPSLILCDVNLETSTMGGFSFFEHVKMLNTLHEVPFVFLTGMNDDVMVRTAKELGADDYLMKPISIENLLSTIRGKLKRFEAFRRKP